MPSEVLNQLLANLRETHKVYASLLEIAEQKQQHILHNDIAGLRKDLQLEERLAGEGTRLSGERRAVHRRSCIALNAPESTEALEDLCRYMPAPWRDRFEAKRTDLRRTLERLHSVNRMNVSLVNSSLDLMEGLLAALFGTERVSAYGRTGVRAPTQVPARALDAKA